MISFFFNIYMEIWKEKQEVARYIKIFFFLLSNNFTPTPVTLQFYTGHLRLSGQFSFF